MTIERATFGHFPFSECGIVKIYVFPSFVFTLILRAQTREASDFAKIIRRIVDEFIASRDESFYRCGIRQMRE